MRHKARPPCQAVAVINRVMSAAKAHIHTYTHARTHTRAHTHTHTHTHAGLDDTSIGCLARALRQLHMPGSARKGGLECLRLGPPLRTQGGSIATKRDFVSVSTVVELQAMVEVLLPDLQVQHLCVCVCARVCVSV
jgi:hypothetical protein